MTHFFVGNVFREFEAQVLENTSNSIPAFEPQIGKQKQFSLKTTYFLNPMLDSQLATLASQQKWIMPIKKMCKSGL